MDTWDIPNTDTGIDNKDDNKDGNRIANWDNN